jgi:acetoacetyl-CoA reductase/3-oxoacyl-[acyl-carrier protein] reductase
VGRLLPDFSGEVALVTGAASGIGHAVARALAAAGARVHGLDRRVPEPAALGALAMAFHTVDVCDTAAVQEAVERIVAEEQRIDLVVCAAGITRDHALWKLSDEEWSAVLDVNLAGAFRVLRAVARPMRAAGRGRIVHIASINGLRGKFGLAAYSASKAGLIGLTRTAARELGPRGITVNAIAPGMIETPMSARLPAEVLRQAVEETATGRLGVPADVVGAVLYLLSDEAAHVTGVVLPVDGGQTC